MECEGVTYMSLAGLGFTTFSALKQASMISLKPTFPTFLASCGTHTDTHTVIKTSYVSFSEPHRLIQKSSAPITPPPGGRRHPELQVWSLTDSTTPRLSVANMTGVLTPGKAMMAGSI